MTTSPEPFNNLSERTAPIVSWLREHDMALPAWMILTCIQPFGWILGQGCLLVEPLSRGLGWDEPITTMMSWMENPTALATLVEALAPDREDS